MRQRDRKKRNRYRDMKESKSRRTANRAFTCKFCNLAVPSVRRLAAHLRNCLHAEGRDRYLLAASDGSDTCDSGSESEYLSCCAGSTTHSEPSLLSQTGTAPNVLLRFVLLRLVCMSPSLHVISFESARANDHSFDGSAPRYLSILGETTAG
jgi:hypothetical protein